MRGVNHSWGVIVSFDACFCFKVGAFVTGKIPEGVGVLSGTHRVGGLKPLEGSIADTMYCYYPCGVLAGSQVV